MRQLRPNGMICVLLPKAGRLADAGHGQGDFTWPIGALLPWVIAGTRGRPDVCACLRRCQVNRPRALVRDGGLAVVGLAR